MKQFTLFCIFLFIGTLSAHTETVQSPYYHTFADMHTFSTFYPRTENSSGEKKSIEYIRKSLEEIGVSHRETPLDGFSGFHSFSSNIEASVEGEREDTLYFLFPLNHPPQAKVNESFSAGIALALAFLEKLVDTTPPLTVKVLFLGAEKGRTADYQIGSRAFLQNFAPPHRTAFVYIDLKKLPNRIAVHPAGSGMVGPSWLVRKTHEALFSSGTNSSMRLNEFQVHRLGVNDEPSPIDPYLKTGLPAVYLTADPEAENDLMPIPFTDLVDYLYGFTGNFSKEAEGIPDKWDSHYLFLQIDEYLLLLEEIHYVIIILIVLALTLLYPFLRPKSFIKYARSISRHIFIVPILFGFMFLFLYLSTFLLNSIMEHRGITILWRTNPLLFLALKVGAAAFLFAVSQHLIRATHLRRLRGSFYSASALVFILIDIILLTLIDMSLTLYGVWIFLFAFFFSSARNRIAKSVYLILAFAPVAVLLVRIFTEPHYEAIRLVLLSENRGNLIITFNLLPLMLMFIRLRMLFHHPNPKITRGIVLSTDLFFALIAIGLSWKLLTFQPYGPSSVQPLDIKEEISVSSSLRSISLSSPVPIGEIELSGSDYQIRRKIEESSFSTRLPLPEDVLDLELEGRNFLGRAIYSVLVVPESPPEKLDVHITSDEPIVLYDCDLPVTHSYDRKRLTVHIGNYPPVPFRFSFTVPAEFKGRITAATSYFSPPYSADFPDERFRIDYRFTEQNSSAISSEEAR